MKLKSLFLSVLAIAAAPAFAADVIVSGQISTNTTWTVTNRYQLSGKVYVVNGATLTIEPGTVIQGRVSSGNDAAALVITRNAKINANGTPDKPIIFTSELDQLNGNLKSSDVGLWGGVVLLGNATINSRADSAIVAAPITDQIEGIVLAGGDTALGTYGGTNDDDNSGTFRYVSIRHGGAVVGTANELNGLSMGGVGRGTTIEYIEVFANRDDGFEWFGGTVNCRYLVAAFCGDDCFDYDQGYRGNLQFLFAIQADNRQADSDDGYLGDKGFEFDGATAPEATATPIGGGTVFNATMIGIGNYTRPNGAAGAANVAMHLRDNGAQKIYNSVFVDYANIFMVDADEQVRIDAGDVKFENNTFFSHLAANNVVNAAGGAGVFASGTGIRPALLTAGANVNVSGQLRAISRTANRGLDPRPAVGSPLLNATVTAPTATYFTATTYRGAFGDSNWAVGWTKLWTEGWFSLATAGSSSFPTQPAGQAANAGGSITFTAPASGSPTYQWQFNGSSINGATTSALSLNAIQPSNAGIYAVRATTGGVTQTSQAAILGVSSPSKLTGQGSEFPDIFHPGTGFTYDQILLLGSAASVTADAGQILRISYVDLNNDIVQVEFSGAGTLSLVLDAVSGPALPQNYNQTVTYMKGHAGIVLSGANVTTNLSVFSVGRANAANQALFLDNVPYDGFADIAFVAITSTDGKFGGLRTANASYFATKGLTGVYAPGVEFTGPVFVGDIRASDDATPSLIIGAGGDVRITGGDLLQDNGRAVQVGGIAQLRFTAGASSHGSALSAQNNRARLELGGADVTARIIVNP